VFSTKLALGPQRWIRSHNYKNRDIRRNQKQWQKQQHQSNSPGSWSTPPGNGINSPRKRYFLLVIKFEALSHPSQFTPKIFEDYDVDIENECCGVCGSDVHTITGGWGEIAHTPICVGHEIIGKVLRVGPKVKEFKTGDRVGVGAQVQSCMKCAMCKSDNENYCPHMVGLYISFLHLAL
jgi:hypothetical protein